MVFWNGPFSRRGRLINDCSTVSGARFSDVVCTEAVPLEVRFFCILINIFIFFSNLKLLIKILYFNIKDIILINTKFL